MHCPCDVSEWRIQKVMSLILMRLCDVFCPYALSVDNTEGDVSHHNDIMLCLFR